MHELAKAYGLGVEAFHKGSFDNPYKRDTLPAKEWQRGWNDAYTNNYWDRRIAAHVEG